MSASGEGAPGSGTRFAVERASSRTRLGLGDLVEMAPRSPLESEGVAPLPGDVGEIVAAPESGDARRCWQVRFIRIDTVWLIPEQFLRRARMH